MDRSTEFKAVESDLVATQAAQTADFFRNCVEELRTPGGASIVDIYYDNQGDQAASRIRRPGSSEFDFRTDDGKHYNLRQGTISQPGLYRLEDKTGDVKTKIDSESDEGKKALATIRAVKFDELDRC